MAGPSLSLFWSVSNASSSDSCSQDAFVARSSQRSSSKNTLVIGDDNVEGAAQGGYPDMGCGRYSQKLTEKEWEDFNNAQRAHYNFVEGVATYIVLILAAGVYYPVYASILGVAILVGRMIFAIGYVTAGAKGRLAGALTVDVALLGLLYFAILSGWNITQGKTNV